MALADVKIILQKLFHEFTFYKGWNHFHSTPKCQTLEMITFGKVHFVRCRTIKKLYFKKGAFRLQKCHFKKVLFDSKMPFIKMCFRFYNCYCKKVFFDCATSKYHFSKQFHRWFDGLKTIRLLKHFTEIA